MHIICIIILYITEFTTVGPVYKSSRCPDFPGQFIYHKAPFETRANY